PPERWTSELHTWCLFDLRPTLAKIEEGPRLEAKGSRKQRSGKLLDSRVVFLNRVVEEPTRRRKLVFDVRQFGLQLLEVLIGLEIRVGFREREQLAQRAGQYVSAATFCSTPGAAIAAFRA